MKQILKWIFIAGIIGLIISPFIIGFMLYVQYQEQKNCQTWLPERGWEPCAKLTPEQHKSYWTQAILGSFLIGIPTIILLLSTLGLLIWGIFKTKLGMILQGIFTGFASYYLIFFSLLIFVLMGIIVITGGFALIGGWSGPDWLDYVIQIVAIIIYLPVLFAFHKLRKNKLFSIGIIVGLIINVIILIMRSFSLF